MNDKAEQIVDDFGFNLPNAAKQQMVDNVSQGLKNKAQAEIIVRSLGVNVSGAVFNNMVKTVQDALNDS